MSRPLPPSELFGSDNLPVGLFRASPTGKLLLFNTAFAELLGYDDEEELSAVNALELYVDPEERRELLAEVFRRGVVRGFEIQLRRRDGRDIWVDLHLAAVGPPGAAVYLEGAAVDITQRRLAESALWESDQRLDLVVGQLPAILWCVDRDLRVTLSVGAALAGLGLRPNQTVGMTIPEYLEGDPTQEQQVQAHLAALGGETQRYSTVLAGRHFEARLEPLRDTHSGIVGVVGVAQDVTERRQAQEQYRDLVERIRVVAWRGDPETLAFRYVAPQAEDLLGHPPRHWIENPSFWLEHLHPEDRERVVGACQAATREGRPHEMEYRLRASDGRYVWVRDMVEVVFENGRAVENVGVLVDISEQKRGEQLRQALLEVSQRAQEARDLSSLCAALHEVVSRYMSARNFYIALRNDHPGTLSFPYFRDERDSTPPTEHAERGLTAWVLRTGRPLLATPEVFRELEAKGEVESVGAVSLDWLGVPLTVEGRTLGVLAVQSYSPSVRYDVEDRDLLVFLSDHVARAIERERSRDVLDGTISMLHSVLNATTDGIMVVDADTKVVLYNQRFAEVWRIPPEQVGRLDDEALLEHATRQLEDPEAFLEKLEALYSQPLAESVDTLVFKDGRVVMRNSRPRFVEGVPMGRVWSFRELSVDLRGAGSFE